jgi:hypothetical protein
MRGLCIFLVLLCHCFSLIVVHTSKINACEPPIVFLVFKKSYKSFSRKGNMLFDRRHPPPGPRHPRAMACSGQISWQ